MAPRSASNWRRPYTSIYNDNYRYGTGLYSDTLTDIEKRYSESLSKTKVRSDRPDLAFSSFVGSNLASSANPGESTEERMPRQMSRSTSSPSRELGRSSTFESRLSTALHSAYTLDEDVQEAINARIEQRKQRALAKEESTGSVGGTRATSGSTKERPKSLCLYDDAEYWSLPKTKPKATASSELDVDTSRSKRKVVSLKTTNGPSSSWREKSRVLQEQVESLENSMSSSGSKLQSELSSLKSKYHSDMSDLNRSVDLTTDQANDLQKMCKRQANQLLELRSAYEDSQRNVSDALDEVNLWQNKCRQIKQEMSRLREELEKASQRTSRD